MTQPQVDRRLAALLGAALLGVLAAVGLVVASLGPVVLAAYVAVVLTGLALLVRRTRSLQRPAEAGRTCACCTSTVFDPVEVR